MGLPLRAEGVPRELDAACMEQAVNVLRRSGVDAEPVEQAEEYRVLDPVRRMRWVRPYRDAYRHDVCLEFTTMATAVAQTWAADPGFYPATYCAKCQMHRPAFEFRWYPDGQRVGT